MTFEHDVYMQHSSLESHLKIVRRKTIVKRAKPVANSGSSVIVKSRSKHLLLEAGFCIAVNRIESSYDQTKNLNDLMNELT